MGCDCKLLTTCLSHQLSAHEVEINDSGLYYSLVYHFQWISRRHCTAVMELVNSPTAPTFSMLPLGQVHNEGAHCPLEDVSASLIWSRSCTNSPRAGAEAVLSLQLKCQAQASWEKQVLLPQKNGASFSFARMQHKRKRHQTNRLQQSAEVCIDHLMFALDTCSFSKDTISIKE